MAENLEELPDSSIESFSFDTIEVTEKEMLKQIIENQQKILEKLQSNEDEINRKRRREESENPNDNPAKRADSEIPKEEVHNESQSTYFEKTGKWFVLKHTFKNVSQLKEGETVYSRKMEHFGINWSMYIKRNDENITFKTNCSNRTATRIWSIETDREVKWLLKNGGSGSRKSSNVYEKAEIESLKMGSSWGWKRFAKWDDLEKNYLIDDTLTFEVSFKIKKMTGIYKANLRSFDDKDYSDVVLIVQNKEFYVSKLYLATHSSYFKAMFLGMFGESKKSEIPLSGIDADDFQNFLEVLYGDDAIDEYTVEGILIVSDMFDTQIVIKKCQNFLLKESQKTLKKKLELSVRYNLEELKKQCLSEIKTSNDIRTVLPPNVCDLDHSLLADLLEKALASN